MDGMIGVIIVNRVRPLQCKLKCWEEFLVPRRMLLIPCLSGSSSLMGELYLVGLFVLYSQRSWGVLLRRKGVVSLMMQSDNAMVMLYRCPTSLCLPLYHMKMMRQSQFRCPQMRIRLTPKVERLESSPCSTGFSMLN